MKGKYLGKNTANELAGAAVKTKRPLSNGLGNIPAGTTGVIDNSFGYVINGKLRFLANKCDCCGLQFRVSGLCYDDLELVGG